MALHYEEYTTTPANWVADTKAAIDTSSDWSNITGDIMKATTTRGAEMVINLNKAAPVNNYATVAFWRTHDGGSGTDEVTRYLHWKYTSGGSTSNVLHCVVSCSKEHLVLLAEGPYSGESNTDNIDSGSKRNMLLMADIVPYHAGDTEPAIATWGNLSSSQSSTSPGNLLVYVSRDQSDSASWVPATIATLTPMTGETTLNIPTRVQHFALGDGKTYLFPYVAIETNDGIRGRLNKVYWAGWSKANNAIEGPGLGENDIVTYDGNDYIIKRNVKAINVSASATYTPFGSVAASTSTGFEPQIALLKA